MSAAHSVGQLALAGRNLVFNQGSRQHAEQRGGARMCARIQGVFRRPGEDLGSYWRRLHREGHATLRNLNCAPAAGRRQQFHGLAGHLARSDDARSSAALHCRPLARWRYWQAEAQGPAQHARFGRPKRWEADLEAWHGMQMASHQGEVVGWMAAAQNREQWRVDGLAFAE